MNQGSRTVKGTDQKLTKRNEADLALDLTKEEFSMNIIQSVLERVEAYRETNQNPCKNYATKKGAEKATKKMAEIMGNRFSSEMPARYIVIYNEAWGRWIGAIDMSELLSRKDILGGYAVCQGFYSY